jgi:hypothetical protein
MDLEYYRRRLAEAVAAAKSAVEPCGRIAHQKMARAYAVVIRNAALPSAKARRPVHEDVIGQWETDGGAPEKRRRWQGRSG